MNLFEIEFWNKSRKDFLMQIQDQLQETNKRIWVATVNPEFVVESWRDSRFFEILKSKTSYNVVDGNGIIWASRGKLNSSNLITGVDLVDSLCKMAVKIGIPVYFLGGWSPEKVAKYFENKYLGLKYKCFGDPDDYVKLDKVAIVFVALGMKKQEFWIEKNLEKLPLGLVVGVGRSFDYYSGEIVRAPSWVRDLKLEWLFSALIDPKRARRQLSNLPWFVWRVMFCSN